MNNKDWTGNTKSVFTTIGASNHSNKIRPAFDFYASPSSIITSLLQKHSIPHLPIWECAAGENNLVYPLEQAGYKVITSDIEQRKVPIDYVEDFLQTEELRAPIILTNPPYACFDSETECYTKRGWLNYWDLKEDDEILSVNPDTQMLEWSGINAIIIKNYQGEAYHFLQDKMDILCTKDHRMFAFSKRTKKIQKRDGDLKLAQDIVSTDYIPRRGYKWVGKNIDYFALPAINGTVYAQPMFKPEIKIPIKDWLQFFGLWLADGYCRHTLNSSGNSRKTIGIKQSEKTADYVRDILNKLPFTVKERMDNYGRVQSCINFNINNEQLWCYLIQFGTSEKKYIPSFIKELSPDLLQIFIDSYFFGDGSRYGENGRTYRTVSKKLAEDIQEILLKLGYLSHISKQKYKTSKERERILYQINCPKKSIYDNIYYPSSKKTKIVNYKGKVWCLNLKKNGAFLLRRNGKEFISGNCAKEFILHSIELGAEYVYMFLKTTFLEGQERYSDLFSKYPPKEIWVFSKRVQVALNNNPEEFKKSSAVSYSWFIWEKGFAGDPTIHWL